MYNCNAPNRSSNAYMNNCGAPSVHMRNETPDTSCACPKGRFPMNTAYAMAYVPFQQSGEVYPHEKALCQGTLFPCLDLPFLRGCCK